MIFLCIIGLIMSLLLTCFLCVDTSNKNTDVNKSLQDRYKVHALEYFGHDRFYYDANCRWFVSDDGRIFAIPMGAYFSARQGNLSDYDVDNKIMKLRNN